MVLIFIDNIILSCGVPRISIKSNGFYTDRIKKWDFIPSYEAKVDDKYSYKTIYLTYILYIQYVYMH